MRSRKSQFRIGANTLTMRADLTDEDSTSWGMNIKTTNQHADVLARWPLRCIVAPSTFTLTTSIPVGWNDLNCMPSASDCTHVNLPGKGASR